MSAAPAAAGTPAMTSTSRKMSALTDPPVKSRTQAAAGRKISRPRTTNAMATPVQRGRAFSPPASGCDMRPLAELRGQSVAVEEIVGVEGDDLALRRDEVDAGALHRGDAEIEAVEELHDHDAEDLVVAEVGRHFDLRQAAKEIAEHALG